MPAPIRIIIDCDPGTDDAVALLLALASPEIDIAAVTVTGGNTGLKYTLANALGLVSLARSRVPVFAGADRSLLGTFANEPRVHGENGLGGVRLSSSVTSEPEIASDAIRRILRSAERPMALIGIGPATNLGLALATEPALTGKVSEVVLMTGAWGEGNITPAAEFNAFNDPEALAILLRSGLCVTLVTLDLTAQALVTPERLDQLRRAGQGRCLSAACDILATIPASPRSGGVGAPLHDPCAVAWLIRPELFSSRYCAVAVDLASGPCRGRTVIDRWQATAFPRNARVLETLDADGFFALLADRLDALP